MLTNTERQQIVDEVNAGTYGIDEALDDIAAAQKGEEVRKALYAEALVLNREGHAGSTDMIARQQIANLQTSVNGQISTLRTEVGDDIDDLETALNSGLATQNGKIAAQNATIANVVANYNVEYGSTELWASTGETGALAAGTTVTLSEDVSHFDYIDIYSFCGNSNVLDTVPVDAKLQSSQGYALRWVNLSDPDSGSYKAYVRIIETRLHIIGTTLTIDHQVTYRNGEEVKISGAEITQSNRSTYMGELGIMKIVGRKITANAEVTDIRTGADGTEYNSAGAAVRGQITEVKAQIPLIDASLATAGKAADAKAVGDELTNVNGRLDELIITNILYDEPTKIVSGTGPYVNENILTINNPIAGTIYTLEFGSVAGATTTRVAFIYSYDENDVRTNHPIDLPATKISYTALPTDSKIIFTLYPSFTGATTATYTDVIIYTGNAPYKYVKPDYVRVEIDGDDIPDASISQQKLSFAELIMPENLFDYTSKDMCKTGWWYYSTSIGSIVEAKQNSNTTHYVAIKVPVYGSTKITLGIYPNDNARLVYWVGAVDADMRLIAYSIVNQNAPVIYNLPAGTVYFLASYDLGSANFAKYLPRVMAVNADAITEYSAYFKPYYLLNDCRADAEKPEEIEVMQSIIGTGENTVKLCLPDAYDLVVGDTFELFYKGIINAVNPDMYDIVIDCSKGSAYSKRFILTPTTAENLTMAVTLYGINHNILDTKVVTLRIHSKATPPPTVKNVLCVGDSLTTSGAWVVELNRRLTGNGGTPEADNLNNVDFIGTRVASGVHYEGYGGWTLNSYNTENVSFNVRVITCTHDKTEAEDQHSIYKDTNNVQWKLETIEEGQIKIIAVTGEGRDFPNSGTLTWVSGGVNHSNIVYSAQVMAPGNPFWDSTAGKVDFASYADRLGVSGIDFVYVLIGWNSASWNETDYKASAQTFINNVHTAYPNAKVVFIGLEIPARDGLGANYGATGIYSRYYDLMQFVFNLDQWYEDVADNNTNVYHVNLAGQFDTEHNMLTATRQVNVRNTETEVYQSNGVHPAYTGSMQIADVAYRDITARLQ